MNEKITELKKYILLEKNRKRLLWKDTGKFAIRRSNEIYNVKGSIDRRK